MSETTPPSTSRVLDDIMTLEEDFKYNLNLLKIRDNEIERCKSVNKGLQDKISKLIDDNKELNKKYIKLQNEYEMLNEQRKREKNDYETQLQKEANEKRKNEEKIQQIFGNRLKQKTDFLQIISEMKIAEQKYKETILQYEIKLEDQMKKCNNLQKTNGILMEENVTFSNKIKDLNANHISDTCELKTDLEKSASKISLLEKQLTEKQNDFKAALNSQNRLVKEKNELQINFVASIEKYNNCLSENQKLAEDLKVSSLNIENLRRTIEALERENENLKKQVGRTDTLIKQNEIMQEVIKSYSRQKKMNRIN